MPHSSIPVAQQQSGGDCPPPLRWQDVLTHVRQNAREWRIERKGAVLTGRCLGTGPPLYILNNVWGTGELMALLMWLLKDDFRTVVSEWPIAKDGSLPRQRLAANALSDDLLAVADFHNDDCFSVFATSFGGLVALMTVNRTPERIHKAVLHAAFARYRLSLLERLLLCIGRFCKRPLREVPLFERIQTHNHRGSFPPFDHSRWEFLLNNLAGTPTRDAVRRISALQRCNLHGVLEQIRTPVLLLGSENCGRLTQQRETELAGILPHAEHDVLPHCGHFPFVTHPHLLTKALKEFVGDTQAKPLTPRPAR